MITPDEAREVVPELELGGDRPFVAACYNPTDGIVFPWPFLWGYARAAAEARRRDPHVDAGHGDRATRARRLFADDARRARSPPSAIVCAAGAWSPAVARAGGRRAAQPPAAARDPVDRAAQAVPEADGHRCCETGLYVSQSLRGELVGGITVGNDQRPMPATARFSSARGWRSRPRWRARWSS